jgi:hypothetical protein
MMIRVYPDGHVVWPYGISQLRQDEPERSISRYPTDAFLANFGVYRIVATNRPAHNPAVERVVAVEPALVDGQWQQQWEIVELTDVEREAAWRAAHPPRWVQFGAAVWGLAEVNALLAAGLTASPALAMALPVGLGQAAQGDQQTFLAAWNTARRAGLISEELVDKLQALAVEHWLPAAFVEALGQWLWPEAPARFDEWSAPDGSRWVWDQPRGVDGQYLADDPDTEDVKSALRWLLITEAE